MGLVTSRLTYKLELFLAGLMDSTNNGLTVVSKTAKELDNIHGSLSIKALASSESVFM